jgi:hypothetical protein
MFLVIAVILLSIAAYAWIVLSTAPEIRAADTTIAANGALEIALLTKSSFNDTSTIINYVGDSLDVQDATDANLTWGNLIDLSDESYGLQKISLKPAYNLLKDDSDDIDDIEEVGYTSLASGSGDSGTASYLSVLSVPSYGSDGRIVETLETVSGVYDYTDSFKYNSASQEYGVRAVGTLSEESNNLIQSVSNRYTITDTYGYIVDLAIRANADTELLLQSAETDRISYEDVTSATMGSGSEILFGYSDDLSSEQVNEILSAIKVAFFDPETGDIYGIAAVSSIVIDDSIHIATGSLYMSDELYDEADEFEDVTETRTSENENYITDLTTGIVKKISMLVYMDGEALSNADAGISETDGTMTVNVQFSSSVELIPAYTWGGGMNTTAKTETNDSN